MRSQQHECPYKPRQGLIILWAPRYIGISTVSLLVTLIHLVEYPVASVLSPICHRHPQRNPLAVVPIDNQRAFGGSLQL